MLPVLALLVAAEAMSPCVVVDADTITLADLAKGARVFAAAPAAQAGYAPQPGERRVFDNAQLNALAQRYQLGAYVGEGLCVERASLHMTPEVLLPVLLAAYPGGKMQIEIKDYLKEPLPMGRLEFAASGLVADPAAARQGWLWRGRVVFGDNRSRPVWVRVAIKGPVRVVKATRALAAGSKLAAGDFSEETREDALQPQSGAALPARLEGMTVKQALPAGAVLTAALLEAEAEIKRGDEILITSEYRGIRLKLKAVAETGGPRGARILARTGLSKRLISAYVAGPGWAELREGNPGAGASLLARGVQGGVQ